MNFKSKKFLIAAGVTVLSVISIGAAIMASRNWSSAPKPIENGSSEIIKEANDDKKTSSEIITGPSPSEPEKTTFSVSSESTGDQDSGVFGVLDIKKDSKLFFKLFYKSNNSKTIQNFKAKIEGTPFTQFDGMQGLDIAKHLLREWESAKSETKSKTFTNFKYFKSNEGTLFKQIQRRGFFGYFDDLNAKDATAYKEKDIVLIIAEKLAGGLELRNDEDIDWSAKESAEVKINSILNVKKTKGIFLATNFILRSSKISNIFKLQGVYGLHIEFGKDLNSHDYESFEKFGKDDFMTACDGLTVFHNYKQMDRDNDIITALDTIKKSGLGAEVDRQYGQGWSTVPYFSVLLISKDENKLKEFEEKLQNEKNQADIKKLTDELQVK